MKNHLQPVTARANAKIRKSGSCGCGSPSPSKQTDYEKALSQKHSVKTKTSSQGDDNSVKRNTVSEVTNVESELNRRTQTVSGNSSSDKKGYKATLTTVKDPSNPGRLVVGPKGGYHEMGSDVAQKQLKNFQRTYLKTKNK